MKTERSRCSARTESRCSATCCSPTTARTTAAHTGEGAQQQLFANRYAAREDGKPALFPLENEQEYAIIKHCFAELKAKLAEQAAAQEGETKA